MQTNPRARVEPSWAPPPPVTPSHQSPVEEQSEGAATANDEADFDATLGHLVEHFATLPPAAHEEPVNESGQPPAAEANAQGERRWVVPLVAMTSALVGAVVTLAVLMGPQRLWATISGDEVPAPTQDKAASTPQVKVRFAPPTPAATPAKTEPLKALASVVPAVKTAAVGKPEPLAAPKPEHVAAPKPEPLAAPKPEPLAAPKKVAPAKKPAKKKPAVTKKKKAPAKKVHKRHVKRKAHRRKTRLKKKSAPKSAAPKSTAPTSPTPTKPKTLNEWKDPYA